MNRSYLNYRPRIEEVIKNPTNYTHFELAIPRISLERGNLELCLRKKNNETQLLIFSFVTDSPHQNSNRGIQIKPLVIGVTGLNSEVPTPAIGITNNDFDDYFPEEGRFLRPDQAEFYSNFSLNHNKTQAVMLPRVESLDMVLRVVVMDLETCSVLRKHFVGTNTKFGLRYYVPQDIGNTEFKSEEMIITATPIDPHSILNHFVNIFKFSTTTFLVEETFKFWKSSRVETRRAQMSCSFTKIDKNSLQKNSDSLMFFRFLKMTWFAGNKVYLCDLVYLNLKNKKILFKLRFEYDYDEHKWYQGINFPFLWKDERVCAVRFGPTTVLILDRKRRRLDLIRHKDLLDRKFHHFLGMFPISFKPRLLRALKPDEYFKVVNLGSKFCGVYSNLKGSCFRLDEFEKLEDYFFVCFYQMLYSEPITFLIFPFRSSEIPRGSK